MQLRLSASARGRARALFVSLATCALGAGCSNGLEGERVATCTDELGCPEGTRCVDGAYCERLSDEGTPRIVVPGVSGAVDLGGGGGVPGSPQLDAGFEQGDDAAVATGCLPGQVRCNEICADVRLDRNHCGGCGIACVGAQECQLGVCCDATRTVCDDLCVDLQSDLRHCGVCGVACPFGASCVLGACLEDLG